MADDDVQAGVFERLDRNRDGSVEADEVKPEHARLFGRLIRLHDGNEDGKLSEQEFIAGTTATPLPASRTPVNRDAQNQNAQNQRPQFDVKQLIARLDRNDDGKLSQEETRDRMRDNFERIDQNEDGFINEAELRRIAAAMRAGGNTNNRPAMADVVRRLKAADGNDDGKISRAEAPEQLRRLFDRVDRNDDGFIDEAEVRRMFSGPRP